MTNRDPLSSSRSFGRVPKVSVFGSNDLDTIKPFGDMRILWGSTVIKFSSLGLKEMQIKYLARKPRPAVLVAHSRASVGYSGSRVVYHWSATWGSK